MTFSPKLVVPGVTADEVVGAHSPDYVVTSESTDHVPVRGADDPVVAGSAYDRRLPSTTSEGFPGERRNLDEGDGGNNEDGPGNHELGSASHVIPRLVLVEV